MRRVDDIISIVLTVVVLFVLSVFGYLVVTGGFSAEKIEKAIPAEFEAKDSVQIIGTN